MVRHPDISLFETGFSPCLHSFFQQIALHGFRTEAHRTIFLILWKKEALEQQNTI